MFNDNDNPFDDALDDLMKADKTIDISYKKRNRRKGKTMVDGLADYDIDGKVFLKTLKKKLCCNGSYKEGILVMFGDHREALKKEISTRFNIDTSNISMHGC